VQAELTLDAFGDLKNPRLYLAQIISGQFQPMH